jgi:hypothetical protein
MQLTIAIRAAKGEFNAVLDGLAGPFFFVEAYLASVKTVLSVIQGALILFAINDELAILDTICNSPHNYTKVRPLFFVFIRTGHADSAHSPKEYKKLRKQ